MNAHKGKRAIHPGEASQQHPGILCAAVEQSTEGVTVIDLEGHVVFVNQAFARMHGYEAEELVGKHFSIFHTPEQMLAVEAAVKQIRETGQFRGEIWHVRRDGTVFPSSMLNTLLRDETGSPTAMLGTLRDTTEQRKAEESLRESEVRYRALFGQAADVMLLLDAKTGTLVEFNDRAYENLGYTRQEFQNLKVSDFDEIESEEQVAEHMAKIVKEGVDTFETRHRTKGGETRHVLVNSRALSIAGRPFVQSICRDITERKRAQERVRLSEEMLRLILNATSDFVYLTDLDGTVLTTNEKGASSLGTTLDELVGNNVFDFLPSGVAKSRKKRGEEVSRSGKPLTFQDERDGRVFNCRIYPIFDQDGSIHRLASFISDVTEHKRIQEELQKNEERYRSLCQRIPCMVYRGGVDWTAEVILNCQPICGYSPDEFTSGRLNWMDMIHPDDRDRVIEEGSRLATRKATLRQEYRIVRKDGVVVWVADHKSSFFDTHGKLEVIDGFVYDVTELRRTEEALRESEKRYRTVFDSSIEGILIADLETQGFKYANAAVCRMLGYTQQELVQLGVLDIHPSEDLEYVVTQFEALGRSEIQTAIAIPCLRKDGTVFHADIIAARMAIDGRSCNVGFFTDVTQRMRAEEEIRRFKAIADQATYGAAIADLEGNLTYVNQSFAEMHGGSPAEFIGLNLSAFHNQEQLSRVDALNERLRREGRFVSEEVWHTRRDGTVFPTLMNAVIVTDAEGRPSFLSATAVDITELKHAEQERKQLEERLRHSQKMEAVGQLAAGVAHEFNNLLVGIIGNAELVARSADRLPEGTRVPLEDIRRSGERAAGLTQQLLTFSKRKVAKVTLFDVGRVVAQAERLLRRLIGPNITMNVARGTESYLIRGDEAELEQVLTNLVVNARDAMSDGGTLTIRIANITIDEPRLLQSSNLSPGPHVELSVTDTGCGMAAETVERIFEPFFTTKPGSQGAGLGLATAFANVKRASGEIMVSSRPGEGTTFCICFPRAEGELEAEATAPDRPLEGTPHGGETILVCDDEDVVLRSLCWLLESGGYSVIPAESGRRALELASAHEGPISLLLTDVIMPEMNGRELANEMTRRRPETRVVYMSGYASDVLEAGGEESDSFEFLQKPSTSDALFRCVREVIDRGMKNENP